MANTKLTTMGATCIGFQDEPTRLSAVLDKSRSRATSATPCSLRLTVMSDDWILRPDGGPQLCPGRSGALG